MRLPKYVVKAFRLKQVTKRKIIYEETEAIPIEYITNWDNHLIGYEQYQVSDIVNQLLQDWREENETD
ncbi:MAG: hypothetical protein J6N95_05570 [Bacilli bacterium]|nr:hypothetical protein [Bacilli bacterium]